MFAAATSNQITYDYYCTLMHHDWSRHKVAKVERRNGNYIYYTYHLITVP